MTAKDAIDVIKGATWLGGSEYGRKTKEALSEANKALEKQIPKKPFRYKKNEYFGIVHLFICPNCQNEMSEDTVIDEYEYCPECGQAIDWSEV